MITNELISEIKSKINDNHKQDITGGVLQGVLVDMVKGLSEAYPQIYTDEEKAQARANIDALSNHNGEITKEKLSAEVQAILEDVPNKQNITDATLATIAKTIVGAINEVYKGGLKDASIATSKIKDGAITEDKLASHSVTNAKIADNAITTEKVADGKITLSKLAKAVRDTLGKVGANIKVLPAGTDLLSSNLEEGIWIVDCSKMANVPSNFSPNGTALLMVGGGFARMFGADPTSNNYPATADRILSATRWNDQGNLSNELARKLDNTSTLTDTEVNNIWDNN